MSFYYDKKNEMLYIIWWLHNSKFALNLIFQLENAIKVQNHIKNCFKLHWIILFIIDPIISIDFTQPAQSCYTSYNIYITSSFQHNTILKIPSATREDKPHAVFNHLKLAHPRSLGLTVFTSA